MNTKDQPNHLQRLFDFLDALERHKFCFSLERNRSETIMVRVDVPVEFWEIEFYADGQIEVESVRSTGGGVMGGSEAQTALKRLVTDFAV
jgi:hypothetical protein